MAKFVRVGEHLINVDQIAYAHVSESGRAKVVTLRLASGFEVVLRDDTGAGPQATLFVEMLRKHAEIVYTY